MGMQRGQVRGQTPYLTPPKKIPTKHLDSIGFYNTKFEVCPRDRPWTCPVPKY
jgi:hypothetical protein